jgi:hypothetical protein
MPNMCILLYHERSGPIKDISAVWKGMGGGDNFLMFSGMMHIIADNFFTRFT